MSFTTTPAKWISVILVSALTGSAATFAAIPTVVKNELQHNVTNTSTAASATPVQQVTYQNGTSIVSAVNKVKPAVVGVINLQKVQDPFQMTDQERAVGEGSGILMDKQGDIITNNHVVAGAQDVQIVIGDQYLKAKVVGTDPVTDLAVVKLSDLSKISNIQPVQFGDSSKLQIGETAIAIGNPLGIKFAQTVTSGVISALSRQVPMQNEQTGQQYTENYLQTDAAINPGNSGGALVDINGNVIGINSAKISSAEGIGFAIPINDAIPIIKQLIQKGSVTRPVIGVQIVNVSDLPSSYQAVSQDGKGVYIHAVNTSAKNQGLQAGDIITKINGKTVDNTDELQQALFTHKPGDTIQITVVRPGGEKTLSVKLQSTK